MWHAGEFYSLWSLVWVTAYQEPFCVSNNCVFPSSAAFWKVEPKQNLFRQKLGIWIQVTVKLRVNVEGKVMS